MTYQVSPWSLTELFPSLDSPTYESAFKQVENCVAEFEKFRTDLISEITPSHFLMILREAEEITRVITRIYSFAGLSFTANTQDQVAQTMQGRVQQLVARFSSRHGGSEEQQSYRTRIHPSLVRGCERRADLARSEGTQGVDA